MIKGDHLIPGTKYKIDNYTGYYKEKVTLNRIYYVFEKVTKDKDVIPVLHFSSNYKFESIKN
jgi:hypothetical protein